jgi:hypothetical protein
MGWVKQPECGSRRRIAQTPTGAAFARIIGRFDEDGSAPLVQLSRDLSVAAKKGTSLAG